MTRPLHPATAAAFNKAVLPMATIIKLNIEGDPLYAWTGLGNISFPAGSTGDAELELSNGVPITYIGTGDILEIGTVTDSIGGSDALEITLPGVNVQDPILRQIIYNRNRWQFKRAIVWMVVLDEVTNAVVGLPFRIKTGRIDAMPFSEDDEGYVRCVIEGQQAYGDSALDTRYSEQPTINPRDISQSWVLSLSNMTAALGTPSSTTRQTSTTGLSGFSVGKANG